MKRAHVWVLAIAGALSLAACGQDANLSSSPAFQPGIDTFDYTLAPAGYALADVSTPAAVNVTGCEASSTRNTYFAAANAIDGNLHSAWAPAAGDQAPTLTLSLGSVTRISRLGLKQSHSAVTVDVAVSTHGGAWQTVATNLAPVETTLSSLDVQSCQGDRVRLTFHGSGLADLLVCEVQVQGTAAGTPVPAPAPAPSALPAPTDQSCSVTAGGWLPSVDAHADRPISFGVVVDQTAGDCQGSLDVDDLDNDQRFHGRVDRARCHGNVVMLHGKLDDGEDFDCTLVSGQQDTMAFTTSSGVVYCGALTSDAQLGGKIQVSQQNDGAATDSDLQRIGIVADHHSERISLDDYDNACEHAGHGRGHRWHHDD